MSHLANAIKAAGMDDEEAADVRALIVKHDGDVKKGLRAYLDELEEDRLDLGRQLKEQGFDLSPRQLRIEPDVAGRPPMTPIRNTEHALALEAEADAKTKRGFGRRVTKGEPAPKPGIGRREGSSMMNATAAGVFCAGSRAPLTRRVRFGKASRRLDAGRQWLEFRMATKKEKDPITGEERDVKFVVDGLMEERLAEVMRFLGPQFDQFDNYPAGYREKSVQPDVDWDWRRSL